MPDQTTPQPDTVGGAFVQALAPDQYAAYADRIADREAAVVAACDIADARTADLPQALAPSSVTSDIAAHVLWHAGRGGYPAGSFTAKLLDAWNLADDSNHAKLASVYPGYAAAFDVLGQTGGVARLRAIAGGESR